MTPTSAEAVPACPSGAAFESSSWLRGLPWATRTDLESSPCEVGKDDLVAFVSGVGWAARWDRAATKGVGFTGVSRLARALISTGISRMDGARRLSGTWVVARCTSSGAVNTRCIGWKCGGASHSRSRCSSTEHPAAKAMVRRSLRVSSFTPGT
jgi:hypothetical protein